MYVSKVVYNLETKVFCAVYPVLPINHSGTITDNDFCGCIQSVDWTGGLD